MELRRFLDTANYYRQSLPHAEMTEASLHVYLHESRKKEKRVIQWTPEAEEAFVKVKADLNNVALLAHPSTRVEIRIVGDSSEFTMGALQAFPRR